MCFAPRYMSGPIARPCTDCRYTASLPETPCASSGAASATRTSAPVRSATALTALVLEMATVAGLIELLARFEDLFGAFLLGRAQRQCRRIDHVARDLHPVALVDGPIADQNH